MSKNKITTKNQITDALERVQGHIEAPAIHKKIIEVLGEVDKAKADKKSAIMSKHSELLTEFARLHEFDKHFLLAESLPPEFGAMAIEMTKSMIREYACNSTAEKSLVEIIVNAFCRTLFFSKKLTMILNRNPTILEQSYINYYNFLSKELDKANRQYLTGILSLQQLKSPTMKVSVKADTAILAQNQQFNSVTEIKNEKDKAL